MVTLIFDASIMKQPNHNKFLTKNNNSQQVSYSMTKSMRYIKEDIWYYLEKKILIGKENHSSQKLLKMMGLICVIIRYKKNLNLKSKHKIGYNL